MATYPSGLFTRSDVPSGTTLGTAVPAHRDRENEIKNEVIAIETELGTDPHVIDATVSVTSTPTTVKQKTDVLSRRIADIVGSFTGSVSLSMATLAGKFDDATGHDHSGSGTNGKPVSHANLTTLTTGDPHTQYAKKAGDTFTGEVIALDFSPSGLTGSVQASRYVGATTSGAPTTGAHVVGDWIVARNGHIWICTTAGTPGTWTDAGAYGAGGGGLTVQEVDGTPSGTPTTLEFPNGTLTDHGSGVYEYIPAGGGASLTVEEVDGSPSSAPTTLQFPNGTLTAPSAGVLRYTPAGGGGSTVSSGVLASRPAAGTAGNVYYATDAPYVFVDNGSTWDAYFQGRKVRLPSDITLTWVNQTHHSVSTAVSYARGYAQMSRALTASTPGQLSALAYAHGASTPWRRTLLFDWSGPDAHVGGTSSGHFVGFLDSVGGKMILLNAWQELTQFRIDYMNSATSFNSTSVAGNSWTDYGRLGPPYGITFENDGTNLAIELTTAMNYNGRKFYSAVIAAFLANAPDQLIFGIYDNSTGGGELSYVTLYGIADA